VKFFAMRYRPGVKLEARKHQVVDRRFESWADAEDARLATDVPTCWTSSSARSRPCR
jgi:hypothetical protein